MTRRVARWFTAAAALGCLTVSACHHASVGEEAAASGYSGSLTLKIVNHSWLDVNIYVMQGTHRERIGTATATSTTEFHIPLRRFSIGADYRLFGDPVGSRQTVQSEALHAQDGDVVTWTLEDNLERSSVDVR
jgi:hypothetical protein